MESLCDYSLWDLISASEAEITTPCAVFDRTWLRPGLGLGKWLELKYVEKASLRCVLHAIIAAALAKSTYSLIFLLDTSSIYSKSHLLSIFREIYQTPSLQLPQFLSKVLIFPCNSIEEMLLQVISIQSFLSTRSKPVLLIVDNLNAYTNDHGKGENTRKMMNLKVVSELKRVKREGFVTIVTGGRENGSQNVVAEISTPLNTVKIGENVLKSGQNDEFVDRKWHLLEGISAPKYPDEVLFPIVQSGLTVAVVKSPWETLLCEDIDMKELGR